ncbi:MAG: 30S ribosomal protein S4 [bacterium]|jgi:small subunit ribosomal protein S4
MTQKKYKLCRRLGAGIYEKCQTAKFAQSEPVAKKGKKGGRRSDYGNQLIEKQKVRFMYGVREKQFSNYVEYAMEHAKKGLSPAELLFRKLEERLDNVIYRLGFANTRALARQMASHGHFTVNGKKLTIPSYAVKHGDVIAIREGSKSSALFKDAAVKLKSIKKPEWLTFDDAALTAKVSGDPKNPDPFLNFQVVIEFYSR